MFEEASKNKLRFKVANGVVSTEDLWTLSLESLDDLARTLNKEIKETEEISFIKETTEANRLTTLKFNIVKHIIQVKLAEVEDRKQTKEKSIRRANILKIIASKQDEALQSKSVDELIKELEALN